MSRTGTFFGIGVGPGEQGLIPILAWEQLQNCGAIYVPKATSQDASTARACLPPHSIPDSRFHEVEFDMSRNHDALLVRYATIAESIASHLQGGIDVAYLTLGDTMTYSTFNYALRAVRKVLPEVRWKIFPGVTSYSALAASTGFSLGEGKERIQILPCPESLDDLETVIKRNDIVILMKIGQRLTGVLELLQRMDLSKYCAFGARIGMRDGYCLSDLSSLLENTPSGYLASMLIRNPTPSYS